LKTNTEREDRCTGRRGGKEKKKSFKVRRKKTLVDARWAKGDNCDDGGSNQISRGKKKGSKKGNGRNDKGSQRREKVTGLATFLKLEQLLKLLGCGTSLWVAEKKN